MTNFTSNTTPEKESPRGAVNALSVDVEDWIQSTLANSFPVTERVLINTRRLLELLRQHSVRGTFFVQGMVAERFSHLVKEIAAEGHEIASHGHTHTPLYKLTPAEFAKDLYRSLAILKNLIPGPVRGYRAPDFSISKDTVWALGILREQGIRYDSSIFPFRGRRYGFPDALRKPHQIVDGLIEVPLSVVRLAGCNWPVAGGGYFRLLPYWVSSWAIRCINAEGYPAVIYLHPYELNAKEMQQFRDWIPWRLYWSQSMNRCRTESKLCSLFRDFTFAPICEIIAL